MRYSFLFFFCTALLSQLVQADPITIPARGVAGLCSTSPTTQASFNATCDPPGVDGIYLLPQGDYNNLTNAPKSGVPDDIDFFYYGRFSCDDGDDITSCQKFTGNFSLPLNSTTCVVFVNDRNKSLNGNLIVSFSQNSSVPNVTSLSSSAGAVVKVGEPWVTLIVAAGVGLASMF